MDTKDSLMDDLADATETIAKALKWWHEEAKSLSIWYGDAKTGDEDNIFDEEPEWVALAKKALADAPPTTPPITSNPVLLSSAGSTLYITDAELLGESPDAMVRQEPADDAKVKYLYALYKSL